MLSFSKADSQEYSKPLCSEAEFERKMENFRRIEASYLSKDEYCTGQPIQIHLEPSGNCNLFCPICPRGRRKIERKGLLTFEIFEKVFKALHQTLLNVLISGFGEPLLNKHTAKMINLASQYAVSTIMNTNGTVLHDHVDRILDAQLTLINISLDGATSDSCHLYNQTYPFSRVVKGVESLRTRKEKGNYTYPSILGQFIITNEPVEEMERLRQWALGIGIERVKFKRKHQTMPGEVDRQKALVEIPSRDSPDCRMTSTENLSWSPFQCSKAWDALFLSCTGDIGLCSFDPYQQMQLGSFKDDMRTLWNGESIRRIRRWHSLADGDLQEPCSKCNRAPGHLKFLQ